MRTMLFILFAALMSVAPPAMSQTKPATNVRVEGIPVDADGMVNFTKVVQTDSVGKAALYARARQWMANTFKNADKTIKMDDPESGTIIAKGMTPIDNTWSKSTKYQMWFSVKIYVKDNRYKYEVTDLYYKFMFIRLPNSPSDVSFELYYSDVYYDKQGQPYKDSKQLKDATIPKIDAIIASLEKAMSESAAKSKSDF